MIKQRNELRIMRWDNMKQRMQRVLSYEILLQMGLVRKPYIIRKHPYVQTVQLDVEFTVYEIYL